MKFRLSKPKCVGRECFVDNRITLTLPKYRGRSLFRGERYCIYEKKAIRFKKTDAQYNVPGWCPRYHKYPIIRVYVRAPADLMYYVYKNAFGDDWEPALNGKDYILRETCSTSFTPNQFVKALTSGLSDYLDLLGYYPDKGAVIEIDNGLDSAFLHLNKDYNWVQIYSFDKEKCDDGNVGGFSVSPHDGRYLDRFSHTTEEYERCCEGYMRGYFADERFQGHWQDNSGVPQAPKLWEESEALLDALKTQGFLQSKAKMSEYCLRFPKGEFKKSQGEFGYIVNMKEHSFFIRCLPDAENYNVYLYAYRNGG